MAKLKKYQMELNKEDKQSESLAYKRRKEELKAVEQMLKHPLSLEEIDKQIKRNTPGNQRP